MRERTRKARLLLSYVTLGVVLMVLIMHPILELIHVWRSQQGLNLWQAIIDPVISAFKPGMWVMMSILAGLGVLFGIAFAYLHLKFSSGFQAVTPISPEDLDAFITEGESERLEFKFSLRWDKSKGKVNKSLEAVVAKILTELMNHQGAYS